MKPFRKTIPFILFSGTIFAQTPPSFKEFTIPTVTSNTLSITTGPDGALWFTEESSRNIGRISTSGVFTEFPGPGAPTLTGAPRAITVGPDGAIWFTDFVGTLNHIGRITTDGTVIEYPILTPECAGSCSPLGIAAGSDGALWFTEFGGNNIGRISTNGVITEYPLPNPVSRPYGITAGPDGALWFAEDQDRIGRITTSGTITEFPTVAIGHPRDITVGPDGALWFTEMNRIGRITTSGNVVEFLVPGFNLQLSEIRSGPDGALWFTESGINKIGRITTAGVITEYPIPTVDGYPVGIAVGSDAALWFTEASGNKIGRLVPGVTITETPLVDPCCTYLQPGNIVAGPDGAVWVADQSPHVTRASSAGATKQFTLPNLAGPVDIAAGEDGALWVTDHTNSRIVRITTTGAITKFGTPTDSDPRGITAGPDGALWFTELTGNKIGRITTNGVITEFPIPTAFSSTLCITTGPDGALWFTENNFDKVGRISTTGTFNEYPVPGAGGLGKIVSGPDGALWFTEANSKIGRITVDGMVTEYPVPALSASPAGIAVGSDGALWFTDYFNGMIGRITTAGLVDEFPIPTTDGHPFGITTGADGEIWFTEVDGHKIGRAVLPLARPTVVPASGSGLSQTLTFRFSDASGVANLGVVNVLINDFLNGQNACYLAYSIPSNTLFLVDDQGSAGGPFAGSMVLNGGGSVIQNSQCQIDDTGSSVTSSGTSVVITLNMTFKAALAGNRIIHVAQRNLSGYTNGWQRVGVWQVPNFASAQITVGGQTPSRGVSTGGVNQVIRVNVSDTSGYTNLGVVNVLINDFINGIRACYIAYSRSSNTLFLVDDAGDAGGPFAGGMVLDGSANEIENTQCRVSGAGSSFAGSGTSGTLTLDIFFKEGFAGSRVIYSAARDISDGNNTGWQALGTWSIQ